MGAGAARPRRSRRADRTASSAPAAGRQHRGPPLPGLIRLTKIGTLRWQAWSLGLVNPRYGVTRRAAARRAQADLDHEWRTGHVASHQRRLRAPPGGRAYLSRVGRASTDGLSGGVPRHRHTGCADGTWPRGRRGCAVYASQKNVQILVSLLKQHGVRHAVLSPGSRNMAIVASLESDPWFTCYSIVDERSAGYFAVGVSLAHDAPVLLSCTSAQATRNYIPAMTEAYYRGVPLVVVTADYRIEKIGQGVVRPSTRCPSHETLRGPRCDCRWCGTPSKSGTASAWSTRRCSTSTTTAPDRAPRHPDRGALDGGSPGFPWHQPSGATRTPPPRRASRAGVCWSPSVSTHRSRPTRSRPWRASAAPTTPSSTSTTCRTTTVRPRCP